MIMKMRKAPGEKAAMENLLAKSEWWLERNMQEMPPMVGALKNSGHTVALVDRVLRIVTGKQIGRASCRERV